MDWNTSLTIYERMRSCKNEDLKDFFFSSAIRYARLRIDWLQAEGDERSRLDESRTLAHNALISSLDSLSRFMANEGQNIAWRKTLGTDRRAIGDLACFLHCILGIAAG